jgi:hypothetical protein
VTTADERQPGVRDRRGFQYFVRGVYPDCAHLVEEPEVPVQSIHLAVDLRGQLQNLDRLWIRVGKPTEDCLGQVGRLHFPPHPPHASDGNAYAKLTTPEVSRSSFSDGRSRGTLHASAVCTGSAERPVVGRISTR